MSEPIPRINWEDVESAATSMFRVWAFGAELEWAKECWRHFERSGLTQAGDEVEETKTYLRLLILARVYEEFCGLMWDENPQTPTCILAENLHFEPVAVGILAGMVPNFDPMGGSYSSDLFEYALQEAANSLRGEIHQCLTDAYGSSEALYSRMAQTNADSIEDSEELGAEFEPTLSHGAALSFVQNRFQN